MLIFTAEYVNTAAKQAVFSYTATSDVALAANIGVFVNINVALREQRHKSYADLSIDAVTSMFVEGGT